MRKVIILATLIAAIGLQVPGQTGQNNRVEEEIRRLNKQEVEALLRNDINTLARLWSDDFVVTNPFNKFINKQQVVGMTESGTLAFTSYDRQVEYVRIYGDTAVVAGNETVVWAGKLPTAGQTSHLRFTGIWMKQGGRWQEVARHANIVVQK
jgi:ketosteroid isomerase-like protein